MAVTITQQPNSLNAAYTRLPYVVSGSVTTSNPQYQYVMDIYESGSSNLISRVTQTKNPSGVAVFDPSRILQGELGQDNDWTRASTQALIDSVKTFDIKFGEQYGTSPSSSVTVYPDLDSAQVVVFPSTVDPNSGDWNFATASYLPVAANSYNSLSKYPSTYNGIGQFQAIGVNDYATMYVLSEDTIQCTDITFFGQLDAPSYVEVILQTGSIISPINGVYGIPAGPKNLIPLSPEIEGFFTSSWDWYGIYFNATNGVNVGSTKFYINPGSDIGEAYEGIGALGPANPCQEYVRFAFLNSNGVWDYYNFYNPVRRSSNIERQNVSLPQLDYSSTSSPYNINNRGQKDYYTQVKDRFEFTTDYIGKEIANYIEEMLNSPSVYVQRGSCFIPVVVTNSTYEHNNNTARNKTFQYTIEFEPANQPYGDWDKLPIDCGNLTNFTTTVIDDNLQLRWGGDFGGAWYNFHTYTGTGPLQVGTLRQEWTGSNSWSNNFITYDDGNTSEAFTSQINLAQDYTNFNTVYFTWNQYLDDVFYDGGPVTASYNSGSLPSFNFTGIGQFYEYQTVKNEFIINATGSV